MQKRDRENKREYFYSTCKEHGLKITPQREAIYLEIADSRTHPTADQLYNVIAKKFPNISYDTVNRTLNTLARIGLIDIIEGYGNPRRYDSNSKSHHHLHCVRCGKVIDFYNSEFDKLDIPKDIPKTFEIISKRVILGGICSDCKKK